MDRSLDLTEDLRCDVALPLSHRRDVLTYVVPQRMAATLQAGCRVQVPVGRQRMVGVVVALFGAGESREPAKLRLVAEQIDAEPVMSSSQLALSRFIAQYYMEGLGTVVRLCLPPDTGKKAKRHLTLTEKGQRAQVFGTGMGLSRHEHELVMRFSPRERKLRRSLKKDGVPDSRIDALIEEGFLVEETAGKPPAGRVESWVESIAGGEPISPRAHALIALDAFLVAARDKVSLSELRLAFSDPRGKVERLAALGRVEVTERTRGSRVGSTGLSANRPMALNADQLRARDAICAAASGAFLLEGVTGSGKTEVYLQVLKQCLASGRGALFIVPEISLTPQLLSRVRSATDGSDVALLHSALTVAERRDALTRLREGTCRVALGARSALFAPVADLGLIVVDEEHDGSLKQDETPRYHARDCALWRAAHEEAMCVLGSATPSLETLENARRGKLTRLVLPERANRMPLPTFTVVDLARRKSNRQQKREDSPTDAMSGVVLSAPLRKAIDLTLAAHDQVLLYVNRRGYAGVLFCDMCGHIEQCPRCTVSLTYHQGRNEVRCHQCGHGAPLPTTCPTCRSALVPLGLGTERVEAEVGALFPNARIARLDRDVVKNTRTLREILSKVQARQVDVLIGTQMVAKGHDFPGIALVGVVLADVALTLPDFRASERAFSLLTQVAGRAGRGDKPGHVMLQTYQPQHVAIRKAVEHDVMGFAEEEMAARAQTFFPPYAKLSLMRIEAETEAVAMGLAESLSRRLQARAESLNPDARWDILGPAPAPLAKLRDRYRVHVFLRCATTGLRQRVLEGIKADAGFQTDLRRAKARFVLDIDPVSVL